MWSCAFYLGNFLGSTIAGITVEKYGFRATTIGFFALILGMLLANFVELFYNIRIARKRDYVQLE